MIKVSKMALCHCTGTVQSGDGGRK